GLWGPKYASPAPSGLMMAGWSRRWVKETRIAPTAESGRRRVIAGITGVCRICPFRACRCRNRRCERQTFVERLPDTAVPVARRTRRVVELLQSLGHTAGGRPGEKLAARFAIPASDNTILRQLKRWAAGRATAAVRAVGIDDWSWRKGWTYGTIIVDLEQHEVVEVIAERSTQTVADWFARHPEVEIVCRDRCGLYSQGAREGAPQARQVVDRFHVLQNLREAIEHQMSHVSRFAGRSL